MKITIPTGTIDVPDPNLALPYNDEQLFEIFYRLVETEKKLTIIEIESLLGKCLRVQDLLERPRYGGEESLFPYGPHGHI
jgi:hypothetical protein